MSDILNETNNILFDSYNNVFEENNSVVMDSSKSNHETLIRQEPVEKFLLPAESASQTSAHSNSDIMKVLKSLEVKLDNMEGRLSKLDSLEKKVISFEKALSNLAYKYKILACH